MLKSLKEKITDILVVVLIPVAIIGAYLNFWTTGITEESFAPASEIEARSQKVREALALLDGIVLDGTVFSDPVFKYLEDQTVKIEDETLGRDNPFVPSDIVKSKTAASRTTTIKTTR